MNIDKMTVDEKLDLIEELWESIRQNPQSLELNPAQKQELDRRLQAHAEDAEPGESWQVVRERLLNKYK